MEDIPRFGAPSDASTVLGKSETFYPFPDEDNALQIPAIGVDHDLSANNRILDSIQPNTFQERAFGCILGAFVGDACGSYNEFATQVATEAFMDECMKMNGGGPWKLAPGQITDDSELAMC